MGRYSVSMWSSFCLTYKHLSNGLHKAKHLEMVFHSSRTSGSADSAEYCWDHMVWKTLFCLIMLMILLVIFIFTLLVTHETAIIIARERIFFFPQIFCPKILWELMRLRFLIWKCKLLLQTLRTFLINSWQDQRQ